MTLQKLRTVADALARIDGLRVYHYWRASTEYPYCIWYELGEVSLEANNHKAEQGFTGNIELFTREEFDTYFEEIQEALNGIENMRWAYDGSSYEDDTNLIHHSWTWRLL